MSMYRRNAGVSLIELMIAMVIGLVLLLGVIQVFPHRVLLHSYPRVPRALRRMGASRWIIWRVISGWLGTLDASTIRRSL